MIIYRSKDLGFVSVKECRGNPGKIQHYFKYQEVMSKLYYQVCPAAVEELSLFQAMNVRSRQSTEEKWDLLFLFLCIFSHSHCYFQISDKYPSTDFFLQGSKAIPSFLSTLAYSSFPLPDKSHHWHQCQAFVNNSACRYPMYKFILLLFINTASATPSEHKKLVQYNSGCCSVGHRFTKSFKDQV